MNLFKQQIHVVKTLLTGLYHSTCVTTFSFYCVTTKDKLWSHAITCYTGTQKRFLENHHLQMHRSFYRSVKMMLRLPKRIPHP